MNSKKKQTTNWFYKIIDFRVLIGFGLIVLYFLGVLIKTGLKDDLLKYYPVEVKAVVINERNYWGNSPVSRTYSYSYEFIVKGKKYKADSRNEKLKIGDTVLVKYVSFFPSFSRMKNK